ncbi:MAG TPA: hypothetical protein VJN63_02435 [Thermoplasmata archaeon]|nr:hypothetical protein [Thermoplasmata archaeon]
MSREKGPRILAGLLVSLMVATAAPALFGAAASVGGTLRANTAGVNAASIAYEFTDFFNVPYPEYWDLRQAIYGDLPIDAECFSAAGIAAGLCTPADPAIPDVPSFPYTNWYPGVGNIQPGNPNADIFVNAPYRMRATGTAVEGYTLAEPVYFPVLKATEAAGSRLDFNWRMQYMTVADAAAAEAAGCPISPGSLDGYHLRSMITLTMDLQESKRLFGVTATDAASAQTWWNANANPVCALAGPVESAVNVWLGQMGGTQFAMGKYDIYNGFEWYYQTFYTQIGATVDEGGTTHVTIEHVAWGTEVLLARFFYWGAASYIENYLDSTKSKGWWGMEVAWFEDLTFGGSFSPAAHSFTLSTLLQYHFQQLSAPGANGIFDRTDDEPYWQWAAWLNDYVNDFSPRHLISELDRYPGGTYIQTAPGHVSYGSALPYDYTPATWDLKSFETMVFRFPTSNIVFYDPNLTPPGADPRTQYVAISAPLILRSTVPAVFGTWDNVAKTLTVFGAVTTGCPVGSPGLDGLAGTADDQYPAEGCPQVNLGLERIVPIVTNADLLGRSAWPERHHWVESRDIDGKQTLYAKVGNLGNVPVNASVVFKIYDAAGTLVATLETAVARDIGVGGSATLSVAWTPTAMGRYRVTAQAMFDGDADGTVDMAGTKLKSFSFAVVP